MYSIKNEKNKGTVKFSILTQAIDIFYYTIKLLKKYIAS